MLKDFFLTAYSVQFAKVVCSPDEAKIGLYVVRNQITKKRSLVKN